MKRNHPISLHSGMTLATFLFWILPIIIITAIASSLLNRNYNRNLRTLADSDINNGLNMVESHLKGAVEDAALAVDSGHIADAYGVFVISADAQRLSQTVSEYLEQEFYRSVNYSAVYAVFRDCTQIASCTPGTHNSSLIHDFSENVLPEVWQVMASRPMHSVFLSQAERLYLVRCLYDASDSPYAALVLDLDTETLFHSLKDSHRFQLFEIRIDSAVIHLISDSETIPTSRRTADISYSLQSGTHTIACVGQLVGLNLWQTTPMLRWIIGTVAAMVIPLLLLIYWIFQRNINRPIALLIDANLRVQSGERGFQIQQTPPNREFSQLFNHFNEMSRELQSQFTQLYQEQQALQQAKINALQSQINPHFLYNTLEIINWEARLAKNDKVCDMIEALSTMLDAAIGRSGHFQVPLSEELKYVDAYLFISQERLGERLVIHREIDTDMLECRIPLLTLQPLVENAIEHSLSRSGGELYLRAYSENDDLCFEVEHDGTISEAGWARIRQSLDPAAAPAAADRQSVGIRNVSNRLRLMYGDNYSLTIRAVTPRRVCAQIILHPTPCNHCKNKPS